MSGSIIHLNIDAHQEAQELLPWFVLGTLNDKETALVQEHLQGCSQCQADLELQRKLQAIPLAPRVELDVNSAFAKLKPQLALTPQEKPAPRLEERLEKLRQAARQWWMPWVIAAQTAALACLCVVLLHSQPPAVTPAGPYQGLGAGAVGNGNLVVMFKPQTSEAELRRILHGVDAHVVDGPTVAGAYLLHVEGADRTRVLNALHGESAVTLAESLEAGAGSAR